ncbi:MAG: TonB-dependent receptor [Wenzhouxiangellaceae bacterium]|nr:TonB-dependent receptor [Wenzhouxiangellaceae bacterium]
MMKDTLLTRAGLYLGLALMLLGLVLVLSGRVQAQPVSIATDLESARLTVLVFEQGRPVEGLTMRFGDAVGRTDEAGFWRVQVPAQSERLTVFDHSQALTALPLELQAGEIAQIIITLKGPQRRAMVSIESSDPDSALQLPDSAGEAEIDADAASGILSGRVVSSEGEAPIAGARVFVSGTPVEVRTDDNGEFRVELASGEYSVSVLHADFATRTIDGVVVPANDETQRRFTLPPAGLELAEFVVIEPFIEGSLSSVVALRRESTAVTDVLSAEQISRAGDSDAGSALKRVTGLTLVDGSFIFVRGLGERYSSVLLNGADLPSPDPTRRVLPMDLFPTDIISQIVVQKTSDASMPGAFGGGTVQLKTVGFPDEFLLKVSYSAGYNSESTGESVATSEGGDLDFTGFDDGTRDVPPLLAEVTDDGALLSRASRFNPDGVDPEQLEAIGEELAENSNFETRERSLPVDRGFSVSTGNSFSFGSDIRAGFLASVRYSDQWRFRDEIRKTFSATNAGLAVKDEFVLQRTLRNIDFSAFLSGGVEISDWTRVGANLMLLRQTEDETRLLDGIEDSQRLQRTKLEWTENELFAVQLLGEHRLPYTGTEADWQFTTGAAQREDPNTREFRRDDDNQDGRFTFSSRADSNSQSWSDVDDDLSDWSVNLRQPFPKFGPVQFTASGGLSRTDRDRVAGTRIFSFTGRLPQGQNQLPQDQVLVPENIGLGALELREDTQATDNFTADQELTASFAMLESQWFDQLTLVAGLRREDNFQTVETNDLGDPNAPPLVSLIDETDDLLSASLTWQFIERAQLRLGFSETLSRPDFREISPAPFTDPLLDLRTVGNRNLRVTSIDNLDARLEYYFNEIDSLSFAYFYKDLTDPIERVVSSGGSGTTIFLENALAAEVEGWEIDIYRSLGFINQWSWLDRAGMGWLRKAGLENYFIAANYADITTSVSIDPAASNQTNSNRALEGASPWVVNAQIGYNSPDQKFEWTLLFNSFGERISRAGALGQPDIFEQPFAQLDFTAKYQLRDHWTFKLGLENLLDSEIEFTQGSETTRIFKPGVKIGLGLEFEL